jgi:glucose-6-phosphate dehydrogenase assembly protein OpcA
MASTVVDRAWRESAPEQVEADLGELWRELATRGPMARAVMSNLVVFRLHERRAKPRREAAAVDPRDKDLPLDAVVARHPSRAIVIEHERGDHDVREPIGAGVGITVFGPPSARYAVEQVVIRSACAEASLPSIVRRFIRGDLPTTVWWTEDASRVPPLTMLVGMARQMVYDSRAWRDVRRGLQAIAPLVADQRIDLADVNWRRLTPLRSALAHAARSASTPIATAGVRITHRPEEEALAWLCAGWLAAQTTWPAGTWPVLSAREGDEILTIEVGETTGSLDQHRAVVRQRGAVPLVVSVPPMSDADAIAAELRSLSFDHALYGALAAAAGHLSRS